MTGVRERTAARVLLLDAAERVLLFHGFDPGDLAAGGWWVTPGGGLKSGEDPRRGAVRELFEESGLRLDPRRLGGPVFEQTVEFSFEGRRLRQSEQFFVARVDRWTVDTTGFTPLEVRSVDTHRWWSLAELRATADAFYPACLPDLLGDLLVAGSPEGA